MFAGPKSRHPDRDSAAFAPTSNPTTTGPILPQPSQSTPYSSYPFFMTRYAAAYAAEIAAFVDAVTTGAPVPTTGHDGLMALALAEAAIRPVRERRAAWRVEVL